MSFLSDSRPNILMIDKEWSSSVLWRRSGGADGIGNCTSYDEFKFPDGLIHRFHFWSAWFEKRYLEAENDVIDGGLWDAYGIALAIDVKRHVRDRYVVYYRTEHEIPFIPFDPSAPTGV